MIIKRNIKRIIYLGMIIIGITAFVLGLTYDYFSGVIIYYGGLLNMGIIVIGGMLTILGLIMFNIERSKTITPKHTPLYKRINILALIALCSLMISLTYIGVQYGQLQTYEQLVGKPILESPFKDMGSKKVIIRNDDVGGEVDSALEWLSNLAVTKNIKMTYAVVPAWLHEHPVTVDYLNNLDKEHFEMATHGYAHVNPLEGMPYTKQYTLIADATKIMEDYLNTKPYTFIPPWHSADVNTTKACRVIGYHSISTPFVTSYVADFATVDFEWESWGLHTVGHYSYGDFKYSFDLFYDSPDEFYVVLLHHETFLDEEGRLNEDISTQLERSIDYMKSRNTEFVTMEEAYQWYVDKKNLQWGKINDNLYFIDLLTCQYDHEIRFHSLLEGAVQVKDLFTGEQIGTYKGALEFHGIKGHYYELVCSSM